MYVSQILPQPQTQIPLTTSFMQVPQQSFAYIEGVPQTRPLPLMAPVLAPVPMPPQLYQSPSYERFIPPIPSKEAPPKVYQFYRYVPVIQQQDFGMIPAVQTTTTPAYQTMSVPVMPGVNYSIIQ